MFAVQGGQYWLSLKMLLLGVILLIEKCHHGTIILFCSTTQQKCISVVRMLVLQKCADLTMGLKDPI